MNAVRGTRLVDSLPRARGAGLQGHHLCRRPSFLSQLPPQDRKAGRVRSLATPELGEFPTVGRAPGGPAIWVGGTIHAAFLGLPFRRLNASREGRAAVPRRWAYGAHKQTHVVPCGCEPGEGGGCVPRLSFCISVLKLRFRELPAPIS